MTPKRVVWRCPNGLHPGVLAGSRPKKNATVRYCLACSEETGVLVERVAPALERQRARKTAARDARAERERQRAREERAQAGLVSVVNADLNEVILDAHGLLDAAWRTAALRDGQRPPELIVRRGAPGKGRGSPQRQPINPGLRADDRISGHAKPYDRRIVLTVRPGLGEAWLRAIVVHEAAHIACGPDEWHGGLWRSAYVRALRELYPDAPIPAMPELDPLPAWRLDEELVRALRGNRPTLDARC
jgi:hypothetical protein